MIACTRLHTIQYYQFSSFPPERPASPHDLDESGINTMNETATPFQNENEDSPSPPATC